MFRGLPVAAAVAKRAASKDNCGWGGGGGDGRVAWCCEEVMAGVVGVTCVPLRLVTKLAKLLGGLPLVRANEPRPAGWPGIRLATGITKNVDGKII